MHIHKLLLKIIVSKFDTYHISRSLCSKYWYEVAVPQLKLSNECIR